MGFRSPLTASQIAAIVGGVVPTAAQNAAATDAAANSVAAANQSATAANQSTTAASNSAVARIRSMTRVSFTMPQAGATSLSVAISVTDISRCQVHLTGVFVSTAPGSVADIPGIVSVSNTSIGLQRGNNAAGASGFIEVMEWI